MSSLASILKQEIVLLNGFIELLKKEQDALKRAEVKVLPEIGEQKTQVVEQLNALENARGHALGLTGDESPRAATLRWLNSNPADGKTATTWKQMLDLAREAKQLHELNGRLVQMHLQQTSELLEALMPPAQKNTLYGSNGQASSATGSRIVDSA